MLFRLCSSTTLIACRNLLNKRPTKQSDRQLVFFRLADDFLHVEPFKPFTVVSLCDVFKRTLPGQNSSLSRSSIKYLFFFPETYFISISIFRYGYLRVEDKDHIGVNRKSLFSPVCYRRRVLPYFHNYGFELGCAPRSRLRSSHAELPLNTCDIKLFKSPV